jgi:hypothetical protein
MSHAQHTNDGTKRSPRRVHNAFHWIAIERERQVDVSLSELIARARVRFGLSDSEEQWLRWSLDPRSVALASKEPG